MDTDGHGFYRREQVRSGKACETGGESPPGLEAKPPEFRAKVKKGKV
jgi:hypothetical protein